MLGFHHDFDFGKIILMEFLIGIGILVALGVWVISIYNRLVALGQRVEQSYADVEVHLNQRHDLIPNLMETVKGYASHERETLDAVVQARNSAVSASGPAAQAGAENMLTGALGKLFALAEAYPDLKANTNFLELQEELSDVENKLAAARRFFNNAVGEFNTGIQQFPAVLFAASFGFSEREFFDLGEDRATIAAVPKVEF